MFVCLRLLSVFLSSFLPSSLLSLLLLLLLHNNTWPGVELRTCITCCCPNWRLHCPPRSFDWQERSGCSAQPQTNRVLPLAWNNAHRLQLPIGFKCGFNPFTATACKTSELKEARKRPANNIFSGPLTSIFNVLSFHHYPSTRLWKKKKKKKKGLKVWNLALFLVVFKWWQWKG